MYLHTLYCEIFLFFYNNYVDYYPLKNVLWTNGNVLTMCTPEIACNRRTKQNFNLDIKNKLYTLHNFEKKKHFWIISKFLDRLYN